MYYQTTSSGYDGEEQRARHEKTLVEELTKLRGPLQRATEYVNEILHELGPPPPKRRRTTENATEALPPWNDCNPNAASSNCAEPEEEHLTGAEDDEWKGAPNLFSNMLCVILYR